ncbi:MAG TPA: glycosyltransferase family 1 protein [Bryobacteraceae bacterium]|nr:glycosyltransferase family 1 protein [Bryobacteraceae bacterium]
MASIGLDASYILGAFPTGSATYSRRLIESLAALDSNHHFVICYRMSRWPKRREFLRPAGTSTRMLTFWRPWRIDLFHSLAQRPPSFRFRREVVTIHDIFPITGHDYSTPEYRRKFSAVLREAMARAACIVTGSRFTAGLLESVCRVERARIRVIPYGVDPPARMLASEERLRERERLVGPGNEMLLSVGNLENRKNIINALRALETLPERYHLQLVGGNGHGHEAIHAFIAEHRLEGRVHRSGYVSLAMLNTFYQSASALVFPSLEEGFGFPVLEAMTHGLPVVTSNTSSIPELGGEAILYADPRDPGAIASQVLQAVESSDVRARMIAAGLARAREFTWKRTAEQTLQVYSEVLGGAST